MLLRSLIKTKRHLSPMLKYVLERPRLFSGKLKQIPLILSTAAYRSCGQPGGSESKFSVKYVAYVKKQYEDHDRKNMMLGRPMSPHLTIYGPNLPAVTSILQRITGMALSAMAVIFAISSLITDRGIEPLINLIQSYHLPEWFIILWKTTIAFSFTFHFFIGIRFVMFNMGKWLTRKVAYQTAYAAILLSIISAVACGLIGHAYTLG